MKRAGGYVVMCRRLCGGWPRALYCQHWDCFDSRFSIPSPKSQSQSLDKKHMPLYMSLLFTFPLTIPFKYFGCFRRLDLCRELRPGRDLTEGREGAVTRTNQRPALASISQSEASSLVWVRHGTGLPDSHTANIYWSPRHRARNK